MRVIIMFLVHFFILMRDYIIFNLCNVLFDADQNAQFSLLTYLRLMQFSYTKIGNFPDDFMFLNEWLHFYSEISKFPEDFMSLTWHTIFIKWIFCIFCVLYKDKKQTTTTTKTYRTNPHCMHFLVENNQNQQKSTYAKKFRDGGDTYTCVVLLDFLPQVISLSENQLS